MSSYLFTKSANLEKLEQEIEASSIVTALDTITSLDTQITISFKATLSAPDESTLNDLVTNHVNTPSPEEAQLVKLDAQTDSDGAIMQKLKITTTGWHLQLHTVEFSTSKRSIDHSKDSNGNDLSFCTMKCYDSNNTEITTDEGLTNCVKTVFSWEPTHDYDISGAYFYQLAKPTENVRMWTVGVPDVPAQYGGSKPFVQGGLNLKFLNSDNALQIDGKTPKWLQYSATNHTNKFSLTFKHEAGLVHLMMIVFEIFKA
jgi:hypothetical protein